MNANRSTSQAVTTASPLAAELQALFRDKVITSDDPRYDSARTVFYGGFDRHPAAIVRVADAGDVARLVVLARDNGFGLSVRSGGHSTAGYGVSEGGVVLDLSTMKNLEIDPKEHTAWAETGMTTGEFTTAASARGFAVGFGDTGSVGLGGLTLGGGVGYLSRKYGLTIDSLLAAEIVTADGQILQVDEKFHPDLFWAIRGGGGNFGVATKFKYRLRELDLVHGGMLVLPATEDVIAGFVKEAEAAPDELSTILNVMIAPPMPFLPKEAHGKLIAMAMMVYAGDVPKGEHVLAPFRSQAQPLADMVRPMHYPEMFPPEESGSFHPIAASRTMFIDRVGHSIAKKILENIRLLNAFLATAQIRVLGGAIARVPVDSTAFAHRKSRIMANIAALYQGMAEKDRHEAWATGFAFAIQQSDKGAYVNFLGNVAEEQIHAAYPGKTWDRLRQVKARYDPTNLFQLNQNIPPMD